MTRYLALELRRSARDHRYVAIVVVWPVLSYLLFSTVFGAAANRAEGLDPHTELMVAMATFGAIGAVLTATGPRLALERQSGWLRQLRLTPMSPTRMVTARLLAALLLTLPTICLTFLAARTITGVSLPLWEWPAMVAVLLIGAIPFAALGSLIGNLSDGDSATGVTMIAYLTLAALGGLWMPASILPAPLRDVAHALPSNRLAQLGWRVAGGHVPPLGAIVVLLAWTVGFGLAAVAIARRVAS
jgi:ABC-2 type transport system permease protein